MPLTDEGSTSATPPAPADLRIRILDIERGGHRIIIDTREAFVRVNCNGATHAQFSCAGMGDLAALKAAVLFAEQVEANALKFPKHAESGGTGTWAPV